MEIKKLNIKDLKEYENNPVIHSKEQITKLAEIIKRYGFRQPIVVTKDNVIIAGHGRLQAVKKLGYKEIDCVVADDLTDEQIKAYRIADNKIKELSTWNDELLKLELEEIQTIDFNILGFDDLDLSILGFTENQKEIHEDNHDEREESENKSTKLNLNDFDNFEHKCPKCGFEFD